MMRIRLTVEYDGTRFSGWQRQKNGLSVQQVVEEALETVAGEPVTVFSSGRTDAGVHALGMTIHFDSQHELPMSAYREGLNRLLPEDVVVHDARPEPDSFHARFASTGKWYRYTVHSAEVRPAIMRGRCWHLRSTLDTELMQKAADMLVGEHDFAAFRTSGCNASTTVRRIDRLDVRSEGDFIHLDVVGSGFLRYMVRRLAGTLVEIASGRRDVASLARMLQNPEDEMAGVTAPAQGLCLMRVLYPGEERDFWENFP
jgi:tRNA pseudouridine38-40 synthase